jgi:hypothetical protein
MAPPAAPAGSTSNLTREVAKGVYLSLQALPYGGYELKRVRFAKQVSKPCRDLLVASPTAKLRPLVGVSWVVTAASFVPRGQAAWCLVMELAAAW